MNTITFPNLNLKLSISQIATTILGVDIYWYAIFIVFGILLAITLAFTSKEKFGIKFEDLIDILITALICGIIGARLYYVFFNSNYYLSNPIKIFYLRDGGLSIIGALILGGIGIIFRAKKLELKPLDLFDYIVPFVAIAQSIGRWGNFFNIEAYGTETNSFLKMGIKTIDGYKEVHPTFFYESICTFVIFCILRILQKNRKFKGQILWLYLIFYSVIRFFIEAIRIDSLMFFDFKITQIVSLIAFVFSLSMYNRSKKYIRNK
ncbi:MAG: prolipoprotein diacylglyceryl transferase [Clostridia bacterium]|nr:prolipoprotein diacylglyceryl transferase [Clostridia bacterium]